MKLKFFDIKNKLFADSFWALLGNVIYKGLLLLSGIIIARILGKDIFGEFSIIKSTFVSLALLSSFGLGYTVTKFISDYKERKPDKLHGIFFYSQKIVLILSSVVCLIVILNSQKIAVNILENSSLEYFVKYASVLIILNCLNLLYVGFLAGLGLFKKMAKINATIGLIAFVLLTSLTYFFGIKGALLALAIVQLINVVINYIVIKKNLPKPLYKKDLKTQQSIVKYSIPIALQEAVYASISWLVSYLIIYYSSYGELGLYTAAIQLNAIILFIPGILRNVVLSHLSGVSNNKLEHNNVLNTILKLNIIVTLIPCLLIFVFNHYVSNLYGETFIGLERLIRLAIFTTVFISISNVYAQAYMSKNLNWTMFGFRLVRDLGKILLFVILINLEMKGSEAMVISHLILAGVFMVIMMSYYKYKESRT